MDSFALLTNVTAISEVHPHLRGITRVINERRHGQHGAVIEWELQTSAMWKPPLILSFLKHIKTYEHVSTTASLLPGKTGRIQNVGIKGNRGKLVPFIIFTGGSSTRSGPHARGSRITSFSKARQ